MVLAAVLLAGAIAFLASSAIGSGTLQPGGGEIGSVAPGDPGHDHVRVEGLFPVGLGTGFVP